MCVNHRVSAMTYQSGPATLSTRWSIGASRTKRKFRIAECDAAVGQANRNRRIATLVIDQALADDIITAAQAAKLRNSLSEG